MHYICGDPQDMKNMNPETFATLSILLICLLLFTAADVLVSLLLKFAAGIPFGKAFLWGCLSLIIPPAAIAYGALVERNIFRVKEAEIACETLPEVFDGYTIVHISDIHARSFEGREGRLRKAMEKVNALNPDIIAFTGDLISMSPDELDGMKDILGGLRAKDGVFSVLGNHDYCMYSDMDEERKEMALERLVGTERAMGWTLLLNGHAVISRGRDSVAVVGVENTSPSRHFPSRGDLTQAAAGTEGMFRILLSHDPLHWEAEIVGKDFPLTLSGHTHAMQFSLLGWSPSRLMFPQYRGLYSTGDTDTSDETARSADASDKTVRGGGASDIWADPAEMTQKASQQYLHVNPGLGETIFPARIGVRPEITLITLKTRDNR